MLQVQLPAQYGDRDFVLRSEANPHAKVCYNILEVQNVLSIFIQLVYEDGQDFLYMQQSV